MSEWFEAENHVERAHQFYEQGRWDDAVRELRAALASDPYQAEWHFNLALTLEAAGRHAEASRAFARVVELNPEDAQAALLAGVNALDADDASRAIHWLEQAERLAPNDPSSYIHRIRAYSRLGDHEQAETMFYLAQGLDPERADLYFEMGEALLDRRAFERALWCLREATRLDGTLPRLHARLAEAMAGTGRHERARQLYMRALRDDPGDLEVLLDLGDLLVQMGRLDEADEKFRRVLELQPDHIDAHFALGDLAARRGDLGTALRRFEVVLRLDAGYAEARRRVAGLILDGVHSGDTEPAQRLLRMDLRDFADTPDRFDDESLRQLVELLVDARLAREARPVARTLVERRPQDPACWHLLSVTLFLSGDLDEGVEAATRSIELDPRNFLAAHNLAYASLLRGCWVRARYWLRRGLAINPEDPGLRRLRSRIRLALVREMLKPLLRPIRGLLGR